MEAPVTMLESCKAVARVLTLGIVLLATLSFTHASDGDQLKWRVVVPFRLFKERSDWERLRPLPCRAPSGGSPCDASVIAWYDRVLAGKPDPWPDPRTGGLAWTPGHYRPDRREYDPGRYEPGYVSPLRYHVEIEVPPSRVKGSCLLGIGESPKTNVPCGSVAAVDVPATGTSISVIFPDGNRATTAIKVEDILVVGLGDSFASGEGNPDRPARIKPRNVAQFPDSRPDSFFQALVAKKGQWFDDYHLAKERGERPASWLDDQCHRSLYSQQNFVAIWLAAADPHRAVTFVHLACSGAEVYDGVIDPQSDPPGGAHKTASQLAELNANLCLDSPMIDGGHGSGKRGEKKAPCKRRAVDVLLLSIGGNDAGFARVAMHHIAPAKGRSRHTSLFYKQVVLRAMKPMSSHEANARIQKLPVLYAKMSSQLPPLSNTSSVRGVYVTQYPDPLFREDGSPCGQCDPPCQENCGRISMFDLFNEMVPDVAKYRDKDWEFCITGNPKYPKGPFMREHQEIESVVLEPLRASVSAAVQSQGWTLVDDFLQSVKVHGMCAIDGSVGSAQQLGWTSPLADGSWTGVDPATWDPYAVRARWFRTIHDSILTQQITTSENRTDQGEVNGMLHPTAEEHAVVADAVVRRILAQSAGTSVLSTMQSGEGTTAK